ncbi:MAG: bifunctional lysine ketoglutarate reductase /saccharopine dehydrogenase family protein [Cyclonatronaceae bacterium]
MNTIGIRHEDKYAPERRTPLVPLHVRSLTREHNIPIQVETSPKRIFTQREFEAAGATVTADLSGCDIILGVKEMPVGYFRKGKIYVYFSHVIKGQPQNMPMLRNLMDAGATLIDYERIMDGHGRRLIFFGRHAGIAGMINTLWTLGQRLKSLGKDNPFEKISQAATYDSLDEARSDIRQVALELLSRGLPERVGPLLIAVTGDGNVARGALEIMDLLPVEKIPADQLAEDNSRDQFNDPRKIFLVNLIPADYMVHKEGKAFDLMDYIAHPGAYASSFEHFLEPVDVLVNGIYWDEKYPRLVTRQWLRDRNAAGAHRLSVIGDITCDPEGSIECTVKATGIEDPVFVYDPATGSHAMGFDGPGVAVMAVDILPSELPRESSEQFSRLLSPWIPALAGADFRVSFDALALPPELKRAIIAHNGRLTPDYTYLEQCITSF